jgi:hypothetical protein
MQMKQIEIDFDVNKLIELERTSFDESPNEALRRLLKLPTKAAEINVVAAPQGKAWSGKGVVLPHGTQLRMEYNGVEYQGTISDGKWDCGGGRHAGPSPAAASVAKTRDGTRPSLNGWIYWSAKLPGATRWVPISTMRKR